MDPGSAGRTRCLPSLFIQQIAGEKSGIKHSAGLHSTEVPYPHLLSTLPSSPRRLFPGLCLCSSQRLIKLWSPRASRVQSEDWMGKLQSISLVPTNIWIHIPLRLVNNALSHQWSQFCTMFPLSQSSSLPPLFSQRQISPSVKL